MKYITFFSIIVLFLSCTPQAEIDRNWEFMQTLKHANEIIDRGTEEMIKESQYNVERRPQLKPISDAAKSIPRLIDPLLQKTDEIYGVLLQEKGIYLYGGELKGKSMEERRSYYEERYELETFVETDDKALDGRPAAPTRATHALLFGEEQAQKLQKQLQQTNDTLSQLVEQLWQRLQEDSIPGVQLYQQEIEQVQNSMRQQLLGDITLIKLLQNANTMEALLLLRQVQNNAKNAAADLVRLLYQKTDIPPIVYDKYEIFASSRTPCITLGETYEAEIALGTYSSEAEFSVEVGGRNLMVEGGKAHYTAIPQTPGTHSYTAKITIKNPLTDRTETFDKEFQYEVGAYGNQIDLQRNNVLYMGIDQEMSVHVSGVIASHIVIKVSGGDVEVKKKASGKYVLRPGRITPPNQPCWITITNAKTGKVLGKSMYRVKQLPDPVASLLSGEPDGRIAASTLRQQKGVQALSQIFDREVACEVLGFTLHYRPKGGAAQQFEQEGARFSGPVLEAIEAAQAGDVFQLMAVKGRCPGDAAGRKLNGLAFVVE